LADLEAAEEKLYALYETAQPGVPESERKFPQHLLSVATLVTYRSRSVAAALLRNGHPGRA
jgi:hypothetical protein